MTWPLPLLRRQASSPEEKALKPKHPRAPLSSGLRSRAPIASRMMRPLAAKSGNTLSAPKATIRRASPPASAHKDFALSKQIGNSFALHIINYKRAMNLGLGASLVSTEALIVKLFATDTGRQTGVRSGQAIA